VNYPYSDVAFHFTTGYLIEKNSLLLKTLNFFKSNVPPVKLLQILVKLTLLCANTPKHWQVDGVVSTITRD